MTDIASAIERLERAVERRPGFGIGTAHAVTTLDRGLRAVTEDGPWRIESDLSAPLGGADTAPSPSVLLRAALGSCMVMSYRLRAARHGVPLTAVRVTVETESAIEGMLDVGSCEPPGFRGVRFHVELESPASLADVHRVLEEGDRLSPVLDVVVRPHQVDRTAAIATGETEHG